MLANYVREDGWRIADHCDWQELNLAFFSLEVLEQMWSVTQRTFDAVRSESMASNRNC